MTDVYNESFLITIKISALFIIVGGRFMNLIFGLTGVLEGSI